MLCSYTLIHLVDLLPLVHLPSLREVEVRIRLIGACSSIHDQKLLLLVLSLAARIFRHYDSAECAIDLLSLLYRLLLVIRCEVVYISVNHSRSGVVSTMGLSLFLGAE